MKEKHRPHKENIHFLNPVKNIRQREERWRLPGSFNGTFGGTISTSLFRSAGGSLIWGRPAKQGCSSGISCMPLMEMLSMVLAAIASNPVCNKYA